MSASLRVALAFTVVISAVCAQGALSILPLSPTSADPVTLRMPLVCGASNIVTRSGRNINVVLQQRGCPSPPIPYAYQVSLGTLPAGQYHVEVRYFVDVPPDTLDFIVLEANPILTVRPFVVPTGTPGFPLHFFFAEDFQLCGNPPACDDWVLDIGGVKYRSRDLVPQQQDFVLYAPDLAAGLHDITIMNSNGSVVVAAAIDYQPPGGAPDPAIFERVLFPVLYSGGGANGSQWRSDAVISNPTPYSIENANSVGPPIQCLVYPCGERLTAGERRAFSGVQYPHGVALMVPRRDAADVDLALRIRDVSREADTLGTEVPVVREAEMVRGELTLLDVPLDPRYRTKLRIYKFNDPIFETSLNNSHVGVRIVAPDGTAISTTPMATGFTRACQDVACAWTPHYLELDLAPRGEGARADIYINFTDNALGWAFASITNNKTQQVTVVTPH